MATDDQQRLVVGVASAPATFTVPGNGQIKPKAIFASYNGSGAATTFTPALKITSDGGKLVGVYPCTSTVAAGASADISWFPGVTGAETAVTPVSPGVVLDYAEPPAGTLNITATTAATANPWIVGNSITLDGLTRVHIECWIALATANQDVVAELYDNGSDVARIAQMEAAGPGGGSGAMSLYGSTHLTPTNGTHQYEIRAWKDAGSTATFLNPTPFPFDIFVPSYYQVSVQPTVP